LRREYFSLPPPSLWRSVDVFFRCPLWPTFPLHQVYTFPSTFLFPNPLRFFPSLLERFFPFLRWWGMIPFVGNYLSPSFRSCTFSRIPPSKFLFAKVHSPSFFALHPPWLTTSFLYVFSCCPLPLFGYHFLFFLSHSLLVKPPFPSLTAFTPLSFQGCDSFFLAFWENFADPPTLEIFSRFFLVAPIVSFPLGTPFLDFTLVFLFVPSFLIFSTLSPEPFRACFPGIHQISLNNLTLSQSGHSSRGLVFKGGHLLFFTP